jgi:tetratricopeptide (TPR) repeat protein
MRFTTKVGAGLLCCAAGTITGYTTARDSFPKQPPVPGFWDVMVWLFSFQDGWAVAAALFAFFSAAYSIWEMFQPGPQTEEEARKHHDREMRSFAAADERQGERHAHDMAGHQTTQAELAALREQIAALTQAVAQTNPGQAAGFAEAAEKLVASGDESDIDLAREVAAGRPEEAADALMREVQEGKQRNAARARQAARLYAPSAPGKAKAAYVEAVALDPTDLWSWIELGRLRMAYDSLAAARQCFGAALQQVTDERDRMALHNEFGNVLMAEGQLRDARSEYEAGLAIADRLAQQEPGNANWQNDLSISFERLGDIELDAGDLAAARTQFESKLAIDLRLVNLDASNSKWQHDLAISYSKLGDIELEAGNLVAARARFDESLTILEMLAAADPGNAEW